MLILKSVAYVQNEIGLQRRRVSEDIEKTRASYFTFNPGSPIAQLCRVRRIASDEFNTAPAMHSQRDLQPVRQGPDKGVGQARRLPPGRIPATVASKPTGRRRGSSPLSRPRPQIARPPRGGGRGGPLRRRRHRRHTEAGPAAPKSFRLGASPRRKIDKNPFIPEPR